MMKIVTRIEAKQLKLKRYFTGVPCKNRHVTERFVSTFCCIECVNDRKKAYYKNNKASCDARDSKWKRENKELVNKHSKNWNNKNPEYGTYIRAQRRAAEKRAIPSWYKNEQKDITKMYKEAKQLTKTTGIIHHVDHIVPLRNEIVCGIHCLDNLQILTEVENLAKSNKFS